MKTAKIILRKIQTELPSPTMSPLKSEKLARKYFDVADGVFDMEKTGKEMVNNCLDPDRKKTFDNVNPIYKVKSSSTHSL